MRKTPKAVHRCAPAAWIGTNVDRWKYYTNKAPRWELLILNAIEYVPPPHEIDPDEEVKRDEVAA